MFFNLWNHLCYWLRHHTFCCVVILASVSFCIHCTTISISPPMWQDEAQIVEMGRIVWTNNSGPSFVLSPNGDKSNIPLNYFGCAFHNIIYSLFSDFIAPRICSVLFLSILSIVVFLWGRKESGNSIFALICSIFVLFDRFLLQSARGGRCDCEAFAIFFAALILLQKAVQYYPEKKRIFFSCIALAACVYMISFAWWITISGLLPFIVCYGIYLFVNKRIMPKDWFYGVGVALICGSICFILLKLSYPSSNPTVTDKAMTNFLHSMDMKCWLQNLTGVFGYFTGSAALSCILFLAWPGKVNFLFLSGFLCSLIFFCFTGIYVFRVIYLIPYGIMGMLLLLQTWKFRGPVFLQWILVLIIVLSGGYSVAGRTFLAFHERSYRDHSWLWDVFARSTVTVNRDKKIFVEPFDLYYVGRHFNWCQYSHGGLIKNQYDYVISSRNSHLVMEINKNYKLVEIIKAPNNMKSVYGPYYIWKKSAD